MRGDETYADHPSRDREHISRDDAELFAFDALRPAHQHQHPEPVVGCWACDFENRNIA